MENIKIGRVYRHFKGNYYYVENIAKDSETLENIVVYKRLYDDCGIYVRPEKMFLETISKRADNITGQTHRFELMEDLSKNYLK